MFRKKRIYLDYAAGPAGNPSSVHEEGRKLKEQLEAARKEVARLVEVKADDIIFTSGATEANALAILGTVSARIKNQIPSTKQAHVLYLPSAHASIVENAKMLAERGVEIEALPIANGRVDIEELKKMLKPETVLVSMEAVCGETGTIWNMREVANVLRGSNLALGSLGHGPHSPAVKVAAAPLLHVDASQAVFTEKLSRSHFSADLLTYDGAKLGVPGTGVLVAHRTIPLTPIYGGGGQERGLRSGTQNVAAITEFARALGNALKNREVFGARAATLKAGLLADFTRLNLRNNASRFNLDINEGQEAIPTILNISVLGRDTDYLAALLDEAGFAVSTKSACESLSGEGSRAVLALTRDFARAASTLRISIGSATNARDLTKFAEALHSAIHFIDTHASR